MGDLEPLSVRLSFLDLTLATIEENLALDEALLVEAEAGGCPPVLRLWEQPCLAVVMGASCRLRDDIQVDLCRHLAIPIARRASGGGTVVVGPGALNATLVLPQNLATGLGAVDAAQSFVLDRIAFSINRLHDGIAVQGSGDLTLGARKIGGSAQRRLRDFFLVHVTILYDFPLPEISRLTRDPLRQPTYRLGRSHEEFLTNLPVDRDRLVAAIKMAWLPNQPVQAASVPRARVTELLKDKFADQAWIERL